MLLILECQVLYVHTVLVVRNSTIIVPQHNIQRNTTREPPSGLQSNDAYLNKGSIRW